MQWLDVEKLDEDTVEQLELLELIEDGKAVDPEVWDWGHFDLRRGSKYYLRPRIIGDFVKDQPGSHTLVIRLGPEKFRRLPVVCGVPVLRSGGGKR